jgi:hypothetical protein
MSVVSSGTAEPSGLPDDVAAWITAAPAVLEATRDASEWGAATRQRALAALDRVANIVTVSRARIVTAEAEAGTWGRMGDRDMAGFLGRESHQGRSAGAAVVDQAATLSAMPVVADALVDGPVTVTHVEQIARATAMSANLAAELATPAGQARLVEMARRYDGAAFGKQLKALGAAMDPMRRQREHEQQRAERYLNISHGPNGTHLKGFLDAVAGYRVVKAIEALDPRPAADDDRDRAKRWADALVTMADGVLRDPGTTPGALVPPQVIVTIGEDTWTALRAARAEEQTIDRGAGADELSAESEAARAVDSDVMRRPAKGSTFDVVAAMQRRTAAVDENGHAWPASEVARLLCECELTRVVLGAESKVLDLGYKERCFDRRHWQALLASGWRTCAYPGCTMPLRWCQLHHLTWWSREGRTDWDNLGPYCCFHHGLIHDRDIRVRRLPGGAYEHRRPDGTLIGITHPAGAAKPLRPRAADDPDASSPGGAPPGRESLIVDATPRHEPSGRQSRVPRAHPAECAEQPELWSA